VATMRVARGRALRRHAARRSRLSLTRAADILGDGRPGRGSSDDADEDRRPTRARARRGDHRVARRRRRALRHAPTSEVERPDVAEAAASSGTRRGHDADPGARRAGPRSCGTPSRAAATSPTCTRSRDKLLRAGAEPRLSPREHECSSWTRKVGEAISGSATRSSSACSRSGEPGAVSCDGRPDRIFRESLSGMQDGEGRWTAPALRERRAPRQARLGA
jgi:hypothetical protein